VGPAHNDTQPEPVEGGCLKIQPGDHRLWLRQAQPPGFDKLSHRAFFFCCSGGGWMRYNDKNYFLLLNRMPV
jgi:hypothetical protein